MRRRRKRKPPTEGWLLTELAALANVGPRVVRYYLEQGLMSRPPFYGTATRYGRNHLLRLLAIRRLKYTENLKLAAIKTRLDGMSGAELDAYASTNLPNPAAAQALGITSPTAEPTPAAGSGMTGDNWQRVAILPGLELHVKVGASPLVHRLARQFYDHCVGTAAAETAMPSGALV